MLPCAHAFVLFCTACFSFSAHPDLIEAFQAAAIAGGSGTEVRKKAAARGLLIRPHGVSVQAMPPLTQLLNIINSGMTPDAAEGGEIDGVKKEANGHPSNGPVDSKNYGLTSGQEDQALVGLGTGLASLDAKKQKAKAKAAG
nr:isoform 2 of clustered mitochondria protein [Quercus suber]